MSDFSWSLLPTEVRLHVLKFFLAILYPIAPSDHASLLTSHLLRLLTTRDRKFAKFAKTKYYTTNTFVLTPEDVVQHLASSYQIDQQLSFHSLPGHTLALTPSTRGIVAWRENWHHALPKLESVSVVLKVQGEQTCPHACGDARQPQTLKGWLSKLSAKKYAQELIPKLSSLRPKVFEFVVECEGCPWRNNKDDGGCECAKRFEKEFVARVSA
jgi:hypothetical protein